MYHSSEVLDLTMKGGNSRSATTLNSPVTTEEAENLDDTIIYQGTNEDEQPEVIEIPEQDDFTSVARGRYCPTWFFDDMGPEVVTKVPEDMDGKKFYMLKTSADKWHDATRDWHNFIMRSSSRVGTQGIRKIGFCHGSLVCPNPKCGFLFTSHQGQPNRINWKTRRGQKDKIYQICNYFATEEGCGARKLVEYLPSEETAYVYHIGNHKFHMKLKVQSKQDAIKRKAQGSTQRTGSAKRIAVEEFETLVGEGRMDEAADEADC